MRSALVLVLIFAGLAGSLLSRHIGLLNYVWFSLFRPIEWIWWNVYWMRLSLVSGLMLIVPCLLTGKLPNVTHPISLLSWAFMGTVVIAHYTSYLASNLDWVDQFFRLLLVVTLSITLVDTKAKLTHLVAVIAGSFAFFSAKAGVSYLMGGGAVFAEGQAGAFADNNGYALAVNMAIPLMAAAGTTLQWNVPALKRIRQGFLVSIPLSVLTVIGTMSRAGLLGLAALGVVFVGLQRRPLLWGGGVLTVAALTFAVAPLPEGYLERMQTIRTYEEVGEGSALSRFHYWHIAVVMVERHPFGVGLRRYDEAYDAHDDSAGAWGFSRSVHNSHLEVLAELGYMGFVLWLVIFAYAFWACLKVRFGAVSLPGLSDDDRALYVNLSTAYMASMFAFIVGGSFIAAANNDLTWMTFGCIAITERLYRADVAALRPARVATDRAAAVVPRPQRKAIA
jgi:putative inorganic carbon (hco3(-)) transporter